MKINRRNLFFLILICFGPSSLQAAFLAEIDFSLTEGYIYIEPTVAKQKGNTVFTGRESGCCNLLSLFQTEKKIPPEDHYFFLNGDPDDLSLSYIQLVCLNGFLQNTTSSSMSFNVMRGESSLSGIFYSGAEVSYSVLHRGFPLMFDVLRIIYFDRYGVDFVEQKKLYETFKFLNDLGETTQLDYSNFVNLSCSEDFRKVFDQNRVVTGNYKDNIFNTSFNGEKLKVTWKAQAWRDETQRNYDALMERYRALYQESKKE